MAVGQPASQTYFEVLVLVLALELWCPDSTPVTLFGDNTAALQTALTMKGRGEQLKLAQVLAVLRSARTLDVEVAHLPSEANLAADALSRQFGPMGDRKAWPYEASDRVAIDTPLAPPALLALIG